MTTNTLTPVAALLTRARARIAEPERWCRESFAKNERGQTVQPRSPGARSWCSVGACRAIGPVLTAIQARYLLDEAAPDDLGAFGVNDERPHAEVMAMFDRAIALAKERGL